MANKGNHTIEADERFCALWADRSNTVEQIAEIYNCSPWAVWRARQRAGLAPRQVGCQRKRKFVKPGVVPKVERTPAPPPEPRPAPAHPDFPLERDGQIMATGGRYAAIAKLAKRWGLPVSRVAARWHLVR